MRQPTVLASLDDLFEGRWERDAQVEQDARSFMQRAQEAVQLLADYFAGLEWWEACALIAMVTAAMVGVWAVLRLRPKRFRLR